MSDETVREEIAGLAEAVRDLRDREVAGELARLRAEIEALRADASRERCCHHPAWPYPYPITWAAPAIAPITVTWPYTVTCGDVADSVTLSGASGIAVTTVACMSTLTTAN